MQPLSAWKGARNHLLDSSFFGFGLQQAAADEAKKLVDAASLAAVRLVDATKEAEETTTAAAAAAALSASEEAQVGW